MTPPRGREIPATPLLKLYRRLHGQPERRRVRVAEGYAADPARLAVLFERSVTAFAPYANSEPFYPRTHKALDRLPAGAPVVRGRDVGRALVPRPGADPFHPAMGIEGLELRLVDYEIEPARTTGRAHFSDGRKATQGMTLDLLLADRGGVPAVCEVKTPGDKDPFFALVQVLACAAHLASDSQRRRLRAHMPGLSVDFDRCDAFVIQVRPAAVPGPALYQPRLRAAALEAIRGIEADPRVSRSIRHLGLLDALRIEDGIELSRAD